MLGVMTMELYRTCGKRLVDIIGATLILLVSLPLLVLCGVGVLLDVGWPVIFRQTRAGLLGKPFRIMKLRSMRNALDKDSFALPDDARVTRFGAMLRATSLDELPGLVNVIKGEMSLVGPRPLPIAYVPLYTENQAKRLCVKPGVTGLAGVSGRNGQAWERIFEHDVRYVAEMNWTLDAKIIASTVLTVLRREGIDRGDRDRSSPFAEAIAKHVQTRKD